MTFSSVVTDDSFLRFLHFVKPFRLTNQVD